LVLSVACADLAHCRQRVIGFTPALFGKRESANTDRQLSQHEGNAEPSAGYEFGP
jgi:hypothetical protein